MVRYTEAHCIHMNRPKAVIFDLDDTLCSYRIEPFDALQRSLGRGEHRALAHALDAERFAALQGRTWAEGQARVQAGEWNPFPYGASVEAARRLLLEAGVVEQAALQQLQTAFLDVLTAHLDLVPGAEEVVRSIKSGCLVGLLTNGPSKLQWGKIERLGIRAWFDAIVVSDDIGIRKPDARIFQALLKRLNVAPQEAAYVGDSLEYDVRGARNAGLISVWLNAGQKGAWDPTQPSPDAQIARLEELLAWLKEG